MRIGLTARQDLVLTAMLVLLAGLAFIVVTLTSTGYGDILPIHPIARSLANLESLIGQIFPATLIAGLVTQHLEWRHHR